MFLKRKISIGLLFLSIFINCDEPKGIGAPKQENFPYLEFGKTIKDFFPEFAKDQNLTVDELKIIGGWEPFGKNDETRYVFVYVFYPNRTVGIGIQDPNEPEGDLKDITNFYFVHDADGLWRIENNWIEIQVRTILLGSNQFKKSDNFYRREMVNWDWQKVIKVSDIHKDGYTIKPFQPIKLPAELEAKLKIKPNYQPWYAFRNFGEPRMNQLLTESFQIHQYPDGTHIFDSIEAYEKYLDDYYKATTW